MKIRQLILLISIMFLSATCTAPKSIFETATNKKYIGKVINVTHMNQGWGLHSTFVQTEIEEFFVHEKLKIKEGTPCYVYANPQGTKVYVIWEGAKESYEIR